MNEPVRILSDLHLGHKISRISQVSALRPLIAGAGIGGLAAALSTADGLLLAIANASSP